MLERCYVFVYKMGVSIRDLFVSFSGITARLADLVFKAGVQHQGSAGLVRHTLEWNGERGAGSR